MHNKQKGFIAEAFDAALTGLVLVWVGNFLLTKRIGGFLLLSFIVGLGSFMVVCGTINVITWDLFDYHGFEPEQCGWIQLLCWGGSALFSGLYMAFHGMWESVDKKCERIDHEVESED